MSVYVILMLALLAALIVTAAVTDIKSRIISNRLNAVIALLAIPWWFSIHLTGYEMLFQLGLALAVFTLFAICFALGMMGGGDVKLLGALGLWLPLTKLLVMIEVMALAGGLLTLGMLIAHKLRKAPGKPEIPYGVAIVGAALLIVTNDILTNSIA
jgi:prepilin peptidase CpaA